MSSESRRAMAISTSPESRTVVSAVRFRVSRMLPVAVLAPVLVYGTLTVLLAFAARPTAPELGVQLPPASALPLQATDQDQPALSVPPFRSTNVAVPLAPESTRCRCRCGLTTARNRLVGMGTVTVTATEPVTGVRSSSAVRVTVPEPAVPVVIHVTRIAFDEFLSTYSVPGAEQDATCPVCAHEMM